MYGTLSSSPHSSLLPLPHRTEILTETAIASRFRENHSMNKRGRQKPNPEIIFPNCVLRLLSPLLLFFAVAAVDAVDPIPFRVGLVVDSSRKIAEKVFQETMKTFQSPPQDGSAPIQFSLSFDAGGVCTRDKNQQESVSAINRIYYQQNIQALFGPTCFTDLEVAARLTDAWNILQFNFWTDHPSDYLANSIVQMTTRSTINVAENIEAFMKAVDWNTAMVFWCSDCYDRLEPEAMRERVENVTYFLKDKQMIIQHTKLFTRASTMQDYTEALKDLQNEARVIIGLMGPLLSDYIPLQTAIKSMNMNLTDYSTLAVLSDWKRNNLKLPFTERPELIDLFENVVVLHNNILNGPGGETNTKVQQLMDNYGISDDDILVYVQLEESLYVLNYLIKQQTSSNYTAQSLLKSLSVVSDSPYGPITFDIRAHRIAPFSVKQMKNGTLKDMGTMTVVDGTCQMGGCLQYTVKDITLFNAGMLTCGIKGELCDQTLTIIIVVVLMASLLMFVGVFMGMRRIRSKESNDMPWMVPYASLKVIELDKQTNGSQHMSLLSLKNHIKDPVKMRQFMGRRVLANFDTHYVILEKYQLKERINFEKAEMTTLFALKQLSHDNLNPFMGMCVEGYLFIIWTHCFRGSLNDIIFSSKEETGIVYDLTFQAAFVRDLLKGLDFLHNSAIEFHGGLTLSQCFVDSHWILKISGFGASRMLYKWKGSNVLQTMDNGPLIPNTELHYYAPEVRKSLKMLMYSNKATELLSKQAGQSGDMYSFGVILFEILFQKRLFHFDSSFSTANDYDDDSLILCDQAEALIPAPSLSSVDHDRYHPDCISLMHKCWSPAGERPDAILARKITDATLKMSGSLVDQMMKNMEAYTNGLQMLVSQRTAQVEVAQRKADELLMELLPKSIVDDLKMGRNVDARTYKAATVMYSDIVGFTSLCSESEPMEVVALLTGMFDKFDMIISQHDGYKMETIGDAYCVASGIPNQNKNDHVRNIATIALLQREFLKTFEIPHRPGSHLHCRWGFNTGPVFTGVVGLRAPRYSVFGESVLIASKMENLGIPDKIQMTLKSHQLLATKFPEFKCIPRGSTRVPNVGTLLTYWLDGIEELLRTDKKYDDDDPYNFQKGNSTISSATSVEPLIKGG